MTKIKITISTVFGSILWESEKDTLKEAVAEKYAKDANLYGANLYGANLWLLPREFIYQCSRDILFILRSLRSEVGYLKQSLIDGKVDGSTYEGECACLVGTLAHGGSVDNTCEAIPFYNRGTHNMGETWFLSIKKGDTPENNQFAAHAMKLIEMVEKNDYYTIDYDPTPEQKAAYDEMRADLIKEDK